MLKYKFYSILRKFSIILIVNFFNAFRFCFHRSYNVYLLYFFAGSYSLKRLHRTYEKMYKEYGPIVREHVFRDRVIVHVYDPQDMHTVYRNEGRLPERRSHRALAIYRKERPETYSCPGLFPR